jgi:hypothetical protein
MSRISLAAVAAVTLLAGCMQTQGERALVGGLAGLAIADATDSNMVAGAALGALAGGASCGVQGLPPCRRPGF